MGNPMKAWLILLIVVLSAGCVSVDLAPYSEDTAAKSFQPAPGQANVYVVNVTWASTHLFPVFLDGRNEGMIAANTYFLIPVRPGRHAVVSSTAESQQGIELETEAGRNYFVSIKARTGIEAPRVSVSNLSDEAGRTAVMKARLAKTFFRPQ
jgi:Protein of unknown function (DUF2846)